MPNGYSDIYEERRLVSVALKGFTGVRYGFRTSVKGTTSTALGHVAGLTAAGTLAAGVVLGANSPKPPRATKIDSSEGYESSFFSYDKLADLRGDPSWTLTAGRLRKPRISKRSNMVGVSARGVTSGTYTYAWVMPKAQYVLLGNTGRTNLGIFDIDDSNYTKALFGINRPKPPRVRGTAGPDPATAKTITTFIGSGKVDNPPAGWNLITTKGTETFGLD
ncbi:MAG: hypothetical protein SAJ12_10515 [Jaaginema sp. PMC 1079.18]|nr:hypothetical protein [Jaaginema sp. PMC 1080.18]MEC4851434.1 hypothetical protein [Jaaginema sp. PMC 1079.18]MEC4866096.1 hypothetical protein [Jaaginema sp. PMC 1078.18]